MRHPERPLPFQDASFDSVLMTDVLEHLPEPALTVGEIVRILRPDRKLILSVPFLYMLHEEPYDYYRYTVHALRRFCALNRLTVVELTPYGGLPEVLFDMSSKFIELLPPRLRGIFRRLHSGFARSTGLSIVKRLSCKTSAQFPLGYLLVAKKTVLLQNAQ